MQTSFMRYISIGNSDKYLLEAISNIFLNGDRFHLDPTYSKGNFYKKQGLKEPKIKIDIVPQYEDVIKSDCRNLNFIDNSSIENIIFDPPFLFRNRKAENRDIMCKRFDYFKTYEDLQNMYKDSLREFYRILKPRGHLIFKCQDMTDGSGSRPFYDTHCFVIESAREQGFSLRDIGILVNKNKIIKKAKKQGCLRKVHSYWLVFRKEKPLF